MFDKSHLKEILVQYKQYIVSDEWNKELFKWEAVKCFQDNWDVKTTDFASMLDKSLDKTSVLLTSWNNFPRRMICSFAKKAPEEVRAMFIALFDESKDVYERIKAFKDNSNLLLEKYGNGAKSHFQDENSISTYLWLRYPDKYYFYKYKEVKNAAKSLNSNYSFKQGEYAENIRNSIKLFDEICNEIKQDTELVNLLRSKLTDECYPDPYLKTLTTDIRFYISRNYSNNEPSPQNISADQWYPADYNPGLSVDDWATLLGDRKIFTQSSLEILRRLKDIGGQASCSQLAANYGETLNFYKTGSSSLAIRIAKKIGCPIYENDKGDKKYWAVLFVGKNAEKDEKGSFIYKLREELSEALNKVDLSHVKLKADPNSAEGEHQYWWLNASPKIWTFSGIDVGEVQNYTLLSESGHKRKIYQNFLDAKAGDLVIGYESTPVKQVVAIAKISAENDGEKLYFEKVESLANPIDYQTLKSFPELKNMEYFTNPQGSLFKLTKEEFDFIMDLIREENPLVTDSKKQKYTKEDFLGEVYMDEPRYDRLVGLLRNKQNVILQGAPGVGKTFAAKRLAYSMMKEVDDNRIAFVQFHQNYSYEDFMMGYKPCEDGFELKNGIFYNFCLKASNQPNKDFFFIIDEINRGNMSKIFGELLMLIEKDYRGVKSTLAYNGIQFSVPSNLYIIGMMNTADRSLAMIDYALRRRFSFFEMDPGFESEGFKKYQERLNNDTFNELINKIVELNTQIATDKSLGKGFCIGHSYFCGQENCTDEWMRAVVDFDILPMLSEYWFDDADKLQYWENILHGVFQ